MIPGVSENMIWWSSSFTIPMIWCRVVCALGVMIDIFSPTNAFIKVDFPALGFPMILTNPALCDMKCCFYLMCKDTKNYMGLMLNTMPANTVPRGNEKKGQRIILLKIVKG